MIMKNKKKSEQKETNKGSLDKQGSKKGDRCLNEIAGEKRDIFTFPEIIKNLFHKQVADKKEEKKRGPTVSHINTHLHTPQSRKKGTLRRFT